VDNNPAGVITAPLVVLENHSLKNLILGWLPFLRKNSTWLENPTLYQKGRQKKATLRHVCLSRVIGQYVWERPHFLWSGSSPPSSCDSCETWGLEWEFRRSANLDGTGSQEDWSGSPKLHQTNEDWSGQWVPIHNIHVQIYVHILVHIHMYTCTCTCKCVYIYIHVDT
jgi:hypothetical protein